MRNPLAWLETVIFSLFEWLLIVGKIRLLISFFPHLNNVHKPYTYQPHKLALYVNRKFLLFCRLLWNLIESPSRYE